MRLKALPSAGATRTRAGKEQAGMAESNPFPVEAVTGAEREIGT